MTSRLIQNVTASKNPQRQDLLSDAQSAEDLLQAQDLPAEYRSATEEDLTQENQPFFGDPFSANLDAKLNREVAILRVVPEGNQYRVSVAHAAQQQAKYTDLFEPPIRLSFGQLSEEDENILVSEQLRQIPGLMHEFSQSKVGNQICSWLKKTFQKTQAIHLNNQFPYVLINDETDCEIPWELLGLSDDNYLDSLLGMLFVAVRLQDIPNLNPRWSNGFHNSLSIEEFKQCDCLGDIVAYTNSEEFPKSVEQERNVLKQFNEFHGEGFNDVDRFLNELENKTSKVSIIYIGSHCFFGKDISQMYFKMSEEKVFYADLNYYGFTFLKESGCIVFMNACHSGRLHRDNRNINDDHRKGFATLFLKKGARGVIGTLGKVSDKYAPQVTENFFMEYLRDQSRPVADILREIRAKAAQDFAGDKRNKEKTLLFIFTFMYVYYGNPITVLQLTKREG